MRRENEDMTSTIRCCCSLLPSIFVIPFGRKGMVVLEGRHGEKAEYRLLFFIHSIPPGKRSFNDRWWEM